jgi:hypothetical protein
MHEVCSDELRYHMTSLPYFIFWIVMLVTPVVVQILLSFHRWILFTYYMMHMILLPDLPKDGSVTKKTHGIVCSHTLLKLNEAT